MKLLGCDSLRYEYRAEGILELSAFDESEADQVEDEQLLFGD